MLALSFSFPGRRYHATPWGRHVNEADVAWPPEPWRILRALIATYWRKGACNHWPRDAAVSLIDALAEAPPIYHLPDGAVHAHTRHYMPAPTRKTLVFDAFAHLPDGTAIVAAWPDLVLEPQQVALVADLADGIGYLGRAESWVECTALTTWDVSEANCLPIDGFGDGARAGELVEVLTPLPAPGYTALRLRHMEQADADQVAAAEAAGKRPPTERALRQRRERTFGVTLPERLMDAIAIDTADLQKHGWSRPPAAREVRYRRASLSPHARLRAGHRTRMPDRSRYTVARYLLAGRPQPRIEDAVRIGELMRAAALSKFGWEQDARTGRSRPMAPPEISGRGESNTPLRDAHHSHAFWLPEDADGDGLIDHVCVYAAAGFDNRVRTALDRLTHLWMRTGGSAAAADSDTAGRREWRLALEGFGTCQEFAQASALFRSTRTWQSVTPFLPTGHLKLSQDAPLARRMLEQGQPVAGALAEATGYPREVRRLLQRRAVLSGPLLKQLQVELLPDISVHGAPRRPLQFHRFRTRGRETATDAHGALLRLRFPEPIRGPVALGYGCHFGLGLFAPNEG